MDIKKLYHNVRGEKDFDDRMICIIKNYYDGLVSMRPFNENEYKEGIMLLRKVLKNEHFDEELLMESAEHMINEDGSSGHHWSVDQVKSVTAGMDFGEYNCYDVTYVMNMLYSDYYPVLGNNTDYYVRMTKLFLNDKDAPPGKAVKYYFSLK